MAKYVFLYTGGTMPETEAEQAAEMEKWGVWYGTLGSAVIDGGNPFAPGAKHIDSNGNVSDNTPGAPASGYTIITAANLDAATKMAQLCPVLQSGGQVSVYEAIEMG